ncbi:MAG TPA: DUF4229 domain-containing protein [Mycobacteriales bacterium]
MKSAAIYTAGRIVVFAVLAGLLWLVGLRGFLLVFAALLLSIPVSYFLLARQRNALAADVERRVTSRQARRQDLRSQLRGDDDKPA